MKKRKLRPDAQTRRTQKRSPSEILKNKSNNRKNRAKIRMRNKQYYRKNRQELKRRAKHRRQRNARGDKRTTRKKLNRS